ncbi:MAG: alpha/beta fold hydrolase [Acidimicrobiales bacterium]
MPRATNGPTEIEYDTFGAPTDPAVLLIMGYTAQMTAWDERFCQQIADRSYFVIRFDNRDVGLSSKTEGTAPSLLSLVVAVQSGEPLPDVPYTLSDMAADGLAVLDDLGVERAHIVGASMGGMIAQQLAIDHPERVISLTSIMSTTGNPEVGQASDEAMMALVSPVPTERDDIIERSVELAKLLTGVHFDDARARTRAANAYDRSFHPAGAGFQMAAIAASGDRTDRLAGLSVPALVIHGAADPLVTPSGGEATAAAIPGATLLMVSDMGHDLPPARWDEIVGAITDLAGAAA